MAQADDKQPAPDLATNSSAIEIRPYEGQPTDKIVVASAATYPGNAAVEPAAGRPDPTASAPQNAPENTQLAASPPVPLASLPGPPAPSDEALPSDKGASSPATENAMANLVNLLVAQHVIARAAGDNLIQQANQEAASVHQQILITRAQSPVSTVAAAQPTSDFAVDPASVDATASAEASSENEVQVRYVPDVVKNQIRDEVEVDLQKKAQDGKFQARDDTPEWVKRFHVVGDIRVRMEGDYFPSGNASGTNFTNFNSINTGSPFNFGQNNSNFPPSYNVDQERDRLRLRARIGAAVDLGGNFTAGIRAATGSDDSPVSENQTLGGANSGQGGNFGKYQLWLDRAFIRYEIGGDSSEDFSVTLGRFDNPFLHTSMIWADDLAFDGAVVHGHYAVGGGVTPFLTAGAFPVFNTDLNFATNQPSKFNSEDKWLYAIQGGTEWKISKDFSAKAAGALYYFDNIEGHVSDPFVPQSASDIGDTDDSRPSFAQNGNSYIALRDITPDSSNDFGLTNQYQYFGLATPFHDVAFTTQIDDSTFDPFHLSLVGELVENVAFDRGDILDNGSANARGPQNNLEDGRFVGGDMGWMVRLNAGKVALNELWDWNVQLSYRYVESDATVDGFTDSDFGGSLAGTNLKGFVIGGSLALGPRVWATLRFMSADQVAGPTYQSDLVQLDVNAKF